MAMRLFSRRKDDLVDLLRHRIETAVSDDRDWIIGVQVAIGVQDMAVHAARIADREARAVQPM